jgi:signal transduction histidine kinase
MHVVEGAVAPRTRLQCEFQRERWGHRDGPVNVSVRLGDSVKEGRATGETGADRGRERAPCPVRRLRLEARAREGADALVCDEDVGDLRSTEVATLHQHGARTRFEKCTTSVDEIIGATDVPARERARLGNIRRHDAGLAKEHGAHRFGHAGLAERVTARRHEHGIDDEGNTMFTHGRSDRVHVLDGAEHAGLRGTDGEIGEHSVDLGPHEGGVGREHACDAGRVLRRQRRDGARAVDLKGRERLQIGLDSGASARIGSCDRECHRSAWVHGSLLNVSTGKRQPSSDLPAGTRARPHGMRSIAARLFLAIGLPSSLVVVALAWTAYVGARDVIEESLFRHLREVTTVAAMHFDPSILDFLEPGSEEARTYQNQAKKLTETARLLGSSRALIIDENGRVLVDGELRLPIGSEAPRAALDRAEIAQARTGVAMHSVPFTVDDGRRFLRAYAPVRGREGDPSPYVLALEAPASLLDEAEDIGRFLAGAALLFILLTLALAVVVARSITAPLLTLADGAAQMGAGALDAPLVVPRGHDEVALLGHTLEDMRKALKERDAERQMMLAGIAHEVRNPLGGMELFSGLLEEGLHELPVDDGSVPLSTKEELLEHTGRVRRELRYLTGVVNDFLAFARDTPIVREPVDVRDLVDDVASLARRADGARIVVDVGTLPRFPLDRGRIKQALLNLVENALQATPADKSVTVRAALKDGCLSFTVDDEGKGIDDATLARVFQPFFTTKEKGSGLGLPLVKKLARDHGGDCSIESSVGRGTRVTLALAGSPVDEAHAVSPEKSAATSANAGDSEEALLGDG